MNKEILIFISDHYIITFIILMIIGNIIVETISQFSRMIRPPKLECPECGKELSKVTNGNKHGWICEKCNKDKNNVNS